MGFFVCLSKLPLQILFFSTIAMTLTTKWVAAHGEICKSFHQQSNNGVDQRIMTPHIPTTERISYQYDFSCANSISEKMPRGGGGYLPAGWNPFGYAITELGLEYLNFDGSLESDVGRFLASMKRGRKKYKVLREQWVEIVRVSKSGQSMRILRKLDDLIAFCLKAGFLD